jgi:hypothetical protein
MILHVCVCMWMGSTNKVLVGKLEGWGHLEDLGVDEKIMLEIISDKYVVN